MGWEHLSLNNELRVGRVGLRCPWDIQTLDGKVQSTRQRSGLPLPVPTSPVNDSVS